MMVLMMMVIKCFTQKYICATFCNSGGGTKKRRKESKQVKFSFQALVCLWPEQTDPCLLCRQVRGGKSFLWFQCFSKQLHLLIFSIATRVNYICSHIYSIANSNYICFLPPGESEGGHLLPLDLGGDFLLHIFYYLLFLNIISKVYVGGVFLLNIFY